MPLDTIPLIKRRTVLLAKLQATNGIAETLIAADGVFNAYDTDFKPEVEMDERELQGGGYLPQVQGPRKATITFKIDIAGAGGTIGADDWTKFLKGCGMAVTLGVWSFASLGATATTQLILTIGHYVDGRRHLMRDAQGTAKFTLKAGRKCTAEFTFTGTYIFNDDAVLPTPDYTGIPIPPRFAQSGAFEVDGTTPCLESVEIDLGNEVVMRECPNDTTGYRSAVIVDRKPMVKINPEARTTAIYNWDAKRAASELIPMTAVVGSLATNKITFDSLKLSIADISFADRSKVVVDEVSLMVTHEDFTITFA